MGQMGCLKPFKEGMSGLLWLFEHGDSTTVAKVFCPLFSTGLGLCIAAWATSSSACDEPSGADYCYVCDEDPCNTPYAGDCNKQGGCWCKGSSYSDYFCVDTDYTDVTFYAIFGGLIMLVFFAFLI